MQHKTKRRCERCDASGPVIYGTMDGIVQSKPLPPRDWLWCSVSCAKCGNPPNPEFLKLRQKEVWYGRR